MFEVTETTWRVRHRPPARATSAVTTTAGWMRPGSLPTGMSKSTPTTSPARMSSDSARAAGDPALLLRRQWFGEDVTHLALALTPEQLPELGIERDAVGLRERPNLVTGRFGHADGRRITHTFKHSIWHGFVCRLDPLR